MGRRTSSAFFIGISLEVVQLKLLIVEDDKELMFLVEHFIQEEDDVDALICESTDEVYSHIEKGFAPDAVLVDFSAQGTRTSIEICSDLSNMFPDCSLYLMSGVARNLMEEATADRVDIDHIFEKPCSVQRMLSHIFRAGNKSGKPITLGLTNYPRSTETQLSTLLYLQEKDPTDVAVKQLYGFCLYTAGKYAEAHKVYNELEKLGALSFLSLYYSGTTCARLQKYSQAIKQWNRALELAPHEGAATRVRERITRARAMMSLEDTDFFEREHLEEPQ